MYSFSRVFTCTPKSGSGLSETIWRLPDPREGGRAMTRMIAAVRRYAKALSRGEATAATAANSDRNRVALKNAIGALSLASILTFASHPASAVSLTMTSDDVLVH